MSDHENHGAPEMSTVSGAQTMPSPNAFVDMFKAAMAPVLSQLTNLNENVSSMLLKGHDDSNEDGETASNADPAKSLDMDADLSALLASMGKDADNEAMPGEDLLKELTQELTVSKKTSPPLREGLAAIFNNLSEKMGYEKLKAKLDKYPCPENPESEPVSLEPAFNCHESSRCKVAEGAKHFYWRHYSHNKSRRFGVGKI